VNKKGETIGQLGIFITIFIVIIIGLALLPTIADNTSIITTKKTVSNETITMPVNGSTLDLFGQAVSGLKIWNSTDIVLTENSNYTLENKVISDDTLTAQITTVDIGDVFAGQTMTLQYTYEPYGYASSGGTRSVSTLIILLTALGIGVIGIILLEKNDVLNVFK